MRPSMSYVPFDVAQNTTTWPASQPSLAIFFEFDPWRFDVPRSARTGQVDSSRSTLRLATTPRTDSASRGPPTHKFLRRRVASTPVPCHTAPLVRTTIYFASHSLADKPY